MRFCACDCNEMVDAMGTEQRKCVHEISAAMIKTIKCTTTKKTKTLHLIISSYNFLTLIEYKKHILLQNMPIKKSQC